VIFAHFEFILSNGDLGVHNMLHYCHYYRNISRNSCNYIVDSRMIFVSRVVKTSVDLKLARFFMDKHKDVRI